MKNLNFFIFNNGVCSQCCSSMKELDDFISAHPKERLEYIMLPFSSIEELNKNGTFKSGIFTTHSSITDVIVSELDYSLSDLITSTMEKLPSDMRSILKSGIFISELNSRISCDQDSLNHLFNSIQHAQIFNCDESIIYNTYNQKMCVTLEVLKSIYNQVLQYNILFTEKYNSIKEKLFLVESFEELKTLMSELYL